MMVVIFTGDIMRLMTCIHCSYSFPPPPPFHVRESGQLFHGMDGSNLVVIEIQLPEGGEVGEEGDVGHLILPEGENFHLCQSLQHGWDRAEPSVGQVHFLESL